MFEFRHLFIIIKKIRFYEVNYLIQGQLLTIQFHSISLSSPARDTVTRHRHHAVGIQEEQAVEPMEKSNWSEIRSWSSSEHGEPSETFVFVTKLPPSPPRTNKTQDVLFNIYFLFIKKIRKCLYLISKPLKRGTIYYIMDEYNNISI